MTSVDSKSQSKRLQPEELIILSREIQGIISAGVPLDMGIRNASLGFSSDLEVVAGKIAERLEGGADIAEAFQLEESIPPVFRAVLVAGLSCGQGEAVLRDVTELTSTQVALRQSLKIGLVYPLIVIFVALALFVGVATTLIPRLAAIERQLSIDSSNWVAFTAGLEVSPVIFVVLFSMFTLLAYFLVRSGKSAPLAGLSWIPGISRVVRDFSIAHFAHLLSLLVTYQIPLPEALRLAGEASAVPRFRNDVSRLADVVEQGRSIQDAMESEGAFPPFLKWLLISGQHEAGLGTTLAHAAEFYRGRAASRAIWLSQVVPTAAVILVGGSITVLYALSVFVPMVDLWTKLAAS